jgi:hypothetical protein
MTGKLRSAVHQMRRSSSDGIATTPCKNQIPVTPRSDKYGEHDHTKSRQHVRMSSKPYRPMAQRASSNSRVELLSIHHDPAVMSDSFQHEPITRIKPASDSLHIPRGVPVDKKEGGQPNGSAIENSAPAFRWYARVRSTSDPDLSTKYAKPKQHSHDVPLKTCLKKKAKNVTTTPPNERPGLVTRSSENRTLRRVKTVDFEEVTRRCPTPLFLTTMSRKMVYAPNGQSSRSSAEAAGSESIAGGMPSCLNMMSAVKSTPADPATTRTDVHVIAIAPSQNAGDTGGNVASDPATPTMQFIESKNGCYEVVWDDVPTEHSIQRRCRRSSASHSLRSVGPTAARGLQRVNSKLTDWSGSWNAPSEAFKPTILVFPDGDGRSPYYECTVDDDEDYMVSPPPNSQKTSAAPSRLSSRPASAPLSRSASHEKMHIGESEVKQGWVVPLADALVVPDLDLQSTRLLDTTRGLRQIPTIRKPSNVEEIDYKFRGHRDSVTLAHSRLMHSGGISPDLFAHRDSVFMARKRMHARNHAISAARDIQLLTGEGDATRTPTMSLDDSVLEMPTMRKHAAQAFRSQESVSILASQQRSEAPRHIRIVE